MKPLLLWLSFSAILIAADSAPAGWTAGSPRPEIAPRTFVDQTNYRTRPGSLGVSGNGISGEHGGWERVISGIEPGAWYRFTTYYQVRGVQQESLQVFSRVVWRNSRGGFSGPVDYPFHVTREGEWNRISDVFPAPPGSAAATLQLFLFNAPQGTIWWDDITFEKTAPPGPRLVTVASLHFRPQKTHSAEENISRFVAAADRAITQKTDIILLPETITVVGNGKSNVDAAEPIPGPATTALGELARRRSSYVVVGIVEREGAICYNTAVLIDRQGRVAGKYRKVQLPEKEVAGGLTPGDDFPVFKTDFGTIGMMICYDVFFPGPANALARRGAEMIFMPIWGGDETLAKARAIENKIFLAASGYDHPTYVMDPDGERIASAPENETAAVVTVDLNKRNWDSWLGDMRARRAREERIDLKTR